MQILGYDINKNHLYIVGSVGLGSRLLFSMINQASDKNEEKKREIQKATRADGNSVCLINPEQGGTQINAVLLDDIDILDGKSSDEVRLLYVEKNNCYIIYGIFKNFSGKKWRFQSTKVENFDGEKCNKISCSNIQSEEYVANTKYSKNNLGQLIASAAITDIANLDIDGDGDSDGTDALIGGLFGTAILNAIDKNTTYGLKINKQGIILLRK